MRSTIAAFLGTLATLCLVTEPSSLRSAPQKKPPAGRNEDDDRRRPPKPPPSVQSIPLPPSKEGEWMIHRVRVITTDHEWNARTRRWERLRPEVEEKVVNRVRITRKDEKPPVVGTGRPTVPGRKDEKPAVQPDNVERRRERLKGRLAQYKLPAPPAPDRWEIDPRLVRALSQAVGDPPRPFTDRVFVCRERRKSDNLLVDTYRVVTYTHRHNGTSWVPVVARHNLIQVPVAEAAKFDLLAVQDQVFRGEFEEREEGGEAELPAQPLDEPQPAVADQPLFRTKYVLLENRGKQVIDVFYFPAAPRPLQGDVFDPPTTEKPRQLQMQPGELVVLFQGERRLQANKLRIWAQDADGRKWDAFKDKDCWLVPDDPKNGRAYRSPRMLLGKVEIAIDKAEKVEPKKEP